MLRRPAGVVAPVIRIDFVAHRGVAHLLCKLQRAHLVGGIGLFINRVGRAQQGGTDSQQAGEEALGQIQLKPKIARGNVADVGMRKGMVPDGVTLLVDAFCQS